ncbi:Ff.00g114730.m01.CDS01 [Fusarium sp. VM40]|nr:Ff.00g114730.m01.CDS01 [Fusarium sp. VM40]
MATTNLHPDTMRSVYPTIDASTSLQQSAKGKVVLITGAGRGIGQAIAIAFAQASAAKLILTALEESELEESRQKVQEINPGIQVFSRALDVRSNADVGTFVSQAAAWAENRIDVLCCNAGISPPLVPIASGDPDQWWMGLEVNLKGVYLFARHVLPIMQAQRAGHIIITASRAATRADDKMSSYQISKLAATRLCECIHGENHEMGIRCFAIHPGGIVTRLLTDMETKQNEPWASEAVKAIRPHLREEISLPGNSCVLLASGRVDFLSGRYVDLTIGFDGMIREEKAIEEHDLFKIGIGLHWSSSGGVVPF